jgi:ethanolamine utilization protein EutN
VIIGRITGRAVSSRKDEGLLGTKLLMAQEVDPTSGAESGDLMIVADHLGAGPGDVVLISQGSAARFTAVTKDQPIDALVVGIVDSVRIDRTETFSREAGFGVRKRPAPSRTRTKEPAP